MKTAVILTIFCFAVTYASPQLNFGGVANRLASNIPRVPNLPITDSISPITDSISPIANRLSSLVQIPSLNSVRDFSQFVAQSGKTYLTEADRIFREGIFAAKNSLVQAQNSAFLAGTSTYSLAHNIFSDLSKSEFLQKLTGNKKTSNGEQLISKHRKPAQKVNKSVPDKWDWRDHGAVTPVKFQGLECGACWSFGVTGAIEGHYFVKTNKLVSLSEQNLIDCSAAYGNQGCDGGYQEYGLHYVIENNGIAAEDNYPYVEKVQGCSYKSSKKAAVISGIGVIEPKDENRMKEIIATLGPIVCSVNASPDSFQLYEKGIYTDKACNEGEVNHTILVVGYGTDETGKDYWIIKNSWTDKWGEKGYMRLPRNADNFCGISSECSYPII